MGFKKAKVKLKRPDGKINTKGYSNFFPDFWNTVKIKEEIAYSLWKVGNPIKVDPITNKYYIMSLLSNGVQVEIILSKNLAGFIQLDNILIFQYK